MKIASAIAAILFVGVHLAAASSKFDGTYFLDYTFTSSTFNGITVPLEVKSEVNFDVRNGKVRNVRGGNLTGGTGTTTKARGTGGVKNGKLDITLTFDQVASGSSLEWSMTFLGSVKVSGNSARGVGTVQALGGGTASGVAIGFEYVGNYLIKEFKSGSSGSGNGDDSGGGGGNGQTPQALEIYLAGADESSKGSRVNVRDGVRGVSLRIIGTGNPTQLRFSGDIPPGLQLNSFGEREGTNTVFTLDGVIPELRFPPKKKYVAVFQSIKTTGNGGRSNKLKVTFNVK